MTQETEVRALGELHATPLAKDARPRLEPIEKPRGLMLKLAYWMLRRQFGTVPTSVKVVVARAPKVMKVMGAAAGFEKKGTSLDKELRSLIGMVVSETNGCAFCLDVGRAFALKDRMDLRKLDALSEYRSSPVFSAKERAALAYVQEVARNRHVADETFGKLREHFSDREVVEITTLAALQTLTNLVNIPLEIGSDGLCTMAQSRK